MQVRKEGIEEEIQDKYKMNRIIKIALCERSEEIDRLQRQCEELKVESEIMIIYLLRWSMGYLSIDGHDLDLFETVKLRIFS